MLPSQHEPKAPEDFIGQAQQRAFQIRDDLRKCVAAKAPVKMLIHGLPGVGKTSLGAFVAAELGISEWSRHHYNGTQVRVEQLDELQKLIPTTSLYDDRRFIQIDEADSIPTVAQTRFLSVLDLINKYPRNVLVCTSNNDLGDLQARFQTRFYPYSVANVNTEELAAWLTVRWGIPAVVARQIAFGSGGNVRAALLDADKATPLHSLSHPLGEGRGEGKAA